MKYSIKLTLSTEVDNEITPEIIKQDISWSEDQIGWNYWYCIEDIDVTKSDL